MSHNKKNRNKVVLDGKLTRVKSNEIDKTIACQYDKADGTYPCNLDLPCVFRREKTCPTCTMPVITEENKELFKDSNIGHCNHEDAQRYARWEANEK